MVWFYRFTKTITIEKIVFSLDFYITIQKDYLMLVTHSCVSMIVGIIRKEMSRLSINLASPELITRHSIVATNIPGRC